MLEYSKEITKRIIVSPEKNKEIQEGVKNISDLKTEIEKTLTQDISVLFEKIVVGAIILNASDIHIEPEKNEVKIRIRIDGFLQDAATIDSKTYQRVLSRSKLLSGVRLNVTDRPQDGRFSILLEEKSIEVRTSNLPSQHGEVITLRLLNPKSLLDLKILGPRQDLLDIFEEEIKKPNGMIIVTGPTGSGKTTTLYSFLKKINKPEINIVTIEDPVEYHVKGLSQTQVNPAKGYDFPSGLQSIMRQDPDVILVGEIRDAKTCQIAIQAALTGHLVFTTLHTNDAAGTIARLTSLEGNLANIGPAVNLVIAQRLVRKVCKNCVEIVSISQEKLDNLKKEFEKFPKINEFINLNQEIKVPEAKGCQKCNFIGYKGRLGLFEAILINDEMEQFILDNPSIAAFREKAIKKGMIPLRQDGLIKVLQGLTTFEEVERVA